METIVQRIKDGTYQPGSFLPTEQKFADEFHVSRNCIREAIKSLSTGGLVVSMPGKGSFLVPDAKEIVSRDSMIVDFGTDISFVELQELRLMVEPEAASIAAQRASPEQLDELERLLEDLKEKMNQKNSWEEVGLGFHHLIAKMTGNSILTKVMNSISEELYKSRKYLSSEYLNQMWHEHLEIYQSIKQKDSERAKILMKLHIENSRDHYLR